MNLTPEDLKFLTFSPIFSQSFKTIFTYKNIFAQITLTSILPLTITFIAHMELSNRFFFSMEQNPYQLLTDAFASYQTFYTAHSTPTDWRNYLLFKSISIAIITGFSVTSTASVSFTVASIYTGRDIAFRKSMKVIPKVWKRLTVTFLCTLFTLFAYSLITSVVIFVDDVVFGSSRIHSFVLLTVIMLYIYGLLHLSSIGQVASVISVLEPSYGLKSMIRSSDLMNGKTKTALTISFLLYQFLAGVVFVYMWFVLYDAMALAPVWRLVIGSMCGVLVVIVFLVGMVSQTVVYLVCKSYHGEAIDLVSLSTYLSAYLSDSRPVLRTGREVIQLGRPQNQAV